MVENRLRLPTIWPHPLQHLNTPQTLNWGTWDWMAQSQTTRLHLHTLQEVQTMTTHNFTSQACQLSQPGIENPIGTTRETQFTFPSNQIWISWLQPDPIGDNSRFHITFQERGHWIHILPANWTSIHPLRVMRTDFQGSLLLGCDCLQHQHHQTDYQKGTLR